MFEHSVEIRLADQKTNAVVYLSRNANHVCQQLELWQLKNNVANNDVKIVTVVVLPFKGCMTSHLFQV